MQGSRSLWPPVVCFELSCDSKGSSAACQQNSGECSPQVFMWTQPLLLAFSRAVFHSLLSSYRIRLLLILLQESLQITMFVTFMVVVG